MNDRLYFRQLLAGRDFARGDSFARQMVNFVYLLGDRETGEALVVDPAWAPGEVVELAAADGMRIVGAVATHHHADHVGGEIFGHRIAGVAELLEQLDVPVHVQQAEVPWVVRGTGLTEADLRVHDATEDVIAVGSLEVRTVHTPGHTPGSQCLLVGGRLVAGDTLFLVGCGRMDLPGGDPAAMYDSLVGRLARLPDDVVLFPGHLYSEEPSATLGETKRWNPVLESRPREEWLSLFG